MDHREDSDSFADALESLPLVSKCIKQRSFNMKEKHVVTVAHSEDTADGGDLLYLVLFEDQSDLDELSEALGAMAGEERCRLTKPPTVGDELFALWDNGWYRARVTHTYPDAAEVALYFVDYGNWDRVPVHLCRRLPPSRRRLPAAAVPCTLRCVRYCADESRRHLQTLVLQTLTLSGPIHARFWKPLTSGDPLQVDLTVDTAVNGERAIVDVALSMCRVRALDEGSVAKQVCEGCIDRTAVLERVGSPSASPLGGRESPDPSNRILSWLSAAKSPEEARQSRRSKHKSRLEVVAAEEEGEHRQPLDGRLREGEVSETSEPQESPASPRDARRPVEPTAQQLPQADTRILSWLKSAEPPPASQAGAEPVQRQLFPATSTRQQLQLPAAWRPPLSEAEYSGAAGDARSRVGELSPTKPPPRSYLDPPKYRDRAVVWDSRPIYRSPLELCTGEVYHQVSIVSAESPADFYISVESQYAFETFCRQLRSTYSQLPAHPRLGVQSDLIQTGSFWVARSDEGNGQHWHRAVVTKIIAPQGGDGNATYRLDCVDHGFTLEAAASSLRPMLEEFASVPVFVVAAGCADVAPLCDEDQFSPRACDEFVRIADQGDISAHTVTTLTTEERLSVVLMTVRNARTVPLGLLLAEQQLTMHVQVIDDVEESRHRAPAPVVTIVGCQDLLPIPSTPLDPTAVEFTPGNAWRSSSPSSVAARGSVLSTPCSSHRSPAPSDAAAVVSGRVSPPVDGRAPTGAAAGRRRHSPDPAPGRSATLGHSGPAAYVRTTPPPAHYPPGGVAAARSPSPRRVVHALRRPSGPHLDSECSLSSPHRRTASAAVRCDWARVPPGSGPPLPEPGTVVYVRVTAVISPSHFYVVLPFGTKPVALVNQNFVGHIERLDSRCDSLELQAQAMRRCYGNKNSGAMPARVRHPSAGDLVALPWNGGWCRGRVFDIHDNVAEVYLLDWGATERLPVAQLRQLSRCFRDAPPLALASSLTAAPRRDWSRAQTACLQLMAGRGLLAAPVHAHLPAGVLQLDLHAAGLPPLSQLLAD